MDILLEAATLGDFLKSLGVEPEAKVKKSNESLAESMCVAILKSIKVKYHKGSGIKSPIGSVTKYKFSLKSNAYVLKATSGFSTGNIMIVLWDGKEESLLQVVTVGEVRDHKALVEIGKKRLKDFLEKKNG